MKETFTFQKLPEMPSASLPVDKNVESPNNPILPEMSCASLPVASKEAKMKELKKELQKRLMLKNEKKSASLTLNGGGCRP